MVERERRRVVENVRRTADEVVQEENTARTEETVCLSPRKRMLKEEEGRTLRQRPNPNKQR